MDKTILIIEDDATQRAMLEAFLHKHMGLGCYKAENGRVAKEILLKHHDKIQLVISDIQMPVMGGLAILKHIRETYPILPVIMITASTDMNDAVEAMKLGAVDFIVKPYDKDRLTITIRNVMKIRSMATEIIRLKNDKGNRFLFNHMIGHNGGLKDVIQLGRKAAMIDLPILINGETGTGKELFAKAIHGESAQSGGPFITVNCGAIPSELVESTLFGHEKGAFTGATEAAIGKFREADSGTLFLDEIGELPLNAQVKLLRVLQEKEVEPVGASRSIKVNVRIISATHRDLGQDVQKGLFREDLYYRLNVLQMVLPPLRDRQKDIPALIDFFMNAIAVRANMPVKNIDDKTIALLRKYPWPGNVRELENALNRAFILSDNQTLTISDFDLRDVTTPTEIPVQNQHAIALKPLHDIEREAIQQAMEHHHHNVTQAAKTLGMAKSTLYRKLQNHKFI
jgi:DNA-binding NtrC family response regulator